METPDRDPEKVARRADAPGPSTHKRAWVFSVVVSALLLPVFAMTPITTAAAKAATATEGPIPKGWVAESAYEVQVSVPSSWKTAYFQNCPYRGAGTLLIGTPSGYDNCAEYPEDTNIVTMEPTGLSVIPGVPQKHLVIHGLHVTSTSKDGSTTWAVRNRDVNLTATGPRSLAVLRTLSVATSQAHAAPGILKGGLYLIAVEKVPVTNLVSVTRLDTYGPQLPAVHSYDGQFSATVAPGRYRLDGHDGSARCPTLSVTVRSGFTTTVRSINCQGE
jgi:hypothetical protein